MLVFASRTTRPSVLHVGAHAAQGPRGLVRLTPPMYRFLSLLSELPPDHVARYNQVAAALWPSDEGAPFDIQGGIRWYTWSLNKLLEQVGYAPLAIRAVDRVGVTFNPVPNETQTRRKQ